MAKSTTTTEDQVVEATNVNIPEEFLHIPELPEMNIYKDVTIESIQHVTHKNGTALPGGGYYQVNFKDEQQSYRFFPNKPDTPAGKEGTMTFNLRILREKAGVRTVPELIGKTIKMFYGINTGRKDPRAEFQLFDNNDNSTSTTVSIEGAI